MILCFKVELWPWKVILLPDELDDVPHIRLAIHTMSVIEGGQDSSLVDIDTVHNIDRTDTQSLPHQSYHPSQVRVHS